jgi:hypothetical protein
MSREHFDDECPGCRPAMVDVKTMQPLADDSIEMKTVNRLWGETSREERLAWHRFTCQNSRSLLDVQLVKTFSDRLEAALVASAKRER